MFGKDNRTGRTSADRPEKEGRNRRIILGMSHPHARKFEPEPSCIFQLLIRRKKPAGSAFHFGKPGAVGHRGCRMKKQIKVMITGAMLLCVSCSWAMAQSSPTLRGSAGKETHERAQERIRKTPAEGERSSQQAPAPEKESSAQPAAEPAAEPAAPSAGQPESGTHPEETDQPDVQKEQPDAAKRGQPKGKGGRAAAVERQKDRFDTIHQQRMARLQRLRELAVENEREEMVTRVDQLIQRELERHNRKTQRFSQRSPAGKQK